MVKGRRGFQSERMSYQLDRLRRPPRLVGDHAQKVMGIGVTLIDLENLPVQLLGEREAFPPDDFVTLIQT